MKHYLFFPSFLVIVLLSASNISKDEDEKIAPSDFKADKLESLIFEKINETRKQKNLNPLKPDAVLRKAALEHAQYQAKTDKLTHFESKKRLKTPADRIEQLDKGFLEVGENVAFISSGIEEREGKKVIRIDYYTYGEAAEKLVNDWVKSPGHYKNIIANYTLTGVAVSLNKEFNRIYAVQEFGKRK
jgi:uncharacterized protein YkwD